MYISKHDDTISIPRNKRALLSVLVKGHNAAFDRISWITELKSPLFKIASHYRLRIKANTFIENNLSVIKLTFFSNI